MKALLLLFLSLSSINSISAQEIEWQNTMGGSADEMINSVRQTTDGGFICGGWSHSNSSPDKLENCIGAADYWIVKIDSSGAIQWENTIGGSSNDVLYSVEQSFDGGYICGGYSVSPLSGDKTEGSLGQYDFWVVKLDSSGNIEWQNTIGGTKNDLLWTVKPTSDGGFICGGSSDSDTSADKSEMCLGTDDYWVVKLNAAGQIEWENTLGGTDQDNLYDIIQTADGGFMCAGSSKSLASPDKSEDSQGRSFWVVKLSDIGIIQWQNTIGGGGGDLLLSVKQTFDGGYLCGGYSDSPIGFDKTENTHGSNDIWIVKLDTTGNIQWQNTIGTVYPDLLLSAAQAADGGYICGGYSWSNINGDKTENRIGSAEDLWIIKLDSTGTILWQNTIGGESSEQVHSIIQSWDGGYVAAGLSSSGISGDKTESAIGGMDYWIVKISDKYNLIQGHAFLDDNSNGNFDTGESGMINKIITETTTGRIGITQNDGAYTVAVPDTGNFEVYGPAWNYYATVPYAHNAYFNNIQQTDSLNDFAIQTTGAYNDLCISLTPAGNFRSGFNASYFLNYSNVGTTVLNPTIIFYPDSNVSYFTADLIPASVTPDSVIWVLGPIAPFTSGKILVTVQINMGLPIGTLINSGVVIEPIANDWNTVCNQSYWELLTTGSADPNDILVSHDTLTTTELANGQYLDYIIRFQNTGNDTAFTVKVLNPIDTSRLDLSTFEFMNSSHPVILNWIPWERNMEFKFDNILLPDSNGNEPGSHGFVRYRIRPVNVLSAGDSVANSGAIYFDFNDPVVTNTAVTDIVLPVSVKEHFVNTVTSYPNPFDTDLTVELHGYPSRKINIELSNVYGQKVLDLYTGNIDSEYWKMNFNLSGLPQGVYMLIIKGKASVTQKIVKL